MRPALTMTIRQRLTHESHAVLGATLYFASWVGAMVGLKYLILEEYNIAFTGFSKAVVGVLLLAKVALVLERVPLGRWVRARPAWVDIALRTALYLAGVAIVLIIERTVRGWGEHGGFLPSLRAALDTRGEHQFWLNLFAIGGALLTYNISAVMRRHLGRGAMLRMLLTPLPQAAPAPSARLDAPGEVGG